jgi:ribonuclease R
VISQELYEAVKNLEDLRNVVSTRKRASGILDFDFPETKIVLDENRFPVDIIKYERYNSMKIIEECMVLANESV